MAERPRTDLMGLTDEILETAKADAADFVPPRRHDKVIPINRFDVVIVPTAEETDADMTAVINEINETDFKTYRR